MTIHGQINGEDYTVPDGYRVIPEAYADRLIGLANILSDLDRNFEGRHEGDSSSGEESGISLGNPRFQTGDHIGFTLYGRPIVVPHVGNRHDPKAWFPPADEEGEQ